MAPAPVAVVAMDEVLARVLINPDGDRWSEIPLGYRLIQAQVEVLLDAEWLVVVESTFTYVAADGESRFHRREMESLIQAARSRGARALLVKLDVGAGLALARQEATDRVSATVVSETVAIHGREDLPPDALILDSSAATPGDLAAAVLAALPCA